MNSSSHPNHLLYFMYSSFNLFYTNKGDDMKKIMSSPVIVGKIDDSISHIANLMKQYNIGFIPIARNNKIVGVITDRDLVVKALSNHVDSNTTIENYITHNVISIEWNQSIDVLLKTMETYQIKRILITEENKVIGIIAFSDLLNHIHANSLCSTLKKIEENQYFSTEENLEIDSFYL